MEEAVKVAVKEGTDDMALSLLVETVLASINEKRPVFSTIAEEPLFYRRFFYRWVKEALEDEAALNKAQQYGMDQLGAMLGNP